MFFVCILQKMKFSCRANKKAAGFSRCHIGFLICRICNFFLTQRHSLVYNFIGKRSFPFYHQGVVDYVFRFGALHERALIQTGSANTIFAAF